MIQPAGKQYNLTFYTLVSSFTILIFSTVSVLGSLFISWVARFVGLKSWILERTNLEITLAFSLLVFLLMTACLVVTDDYVSDRILIWQKKLGVNLLLSLAIMLLLIVFVSVIIGFSLYIVFLKKTFWV